MSQHFFSGNRTCDDAKDRDKAQIVPEFFNNLHVMRSAMRSFCTHKLMVGSGTGKILRIRTDPDPTTTWYWPCPALSWLSWPRGPGWPTARGWPDPPAPCCAAGCSLNRGGEVFDIAGDTFGHRLIRARWAKPVVITYLLLTFLGSRHCIDSISIGTTCSTLLPASDPDRRPGNAQPKYKQHVLIWSYCQYRGGGWV